MRKLILALGVVLVLASFTNNTNKTIVLKDIDGTLLQSYPIIENVTGEYTVTFTTDANTVVTANTVDNETHIYLVQNGISSKTVTHTLTFNSKVIGFNHYFQNNSDVASVDNVSGTLTIGDKPRGLILV